MVRLARLVLMAALVVPQVAMADEERIPVRLAVGDTVEIEVGYARMHLCDDTSIVAAEMRDKTAETNVFVVTGLRAGTTACRAGLDEDRPTFLFAITVVDRPAPTRPARPARPTGPRTPAGPKPR